MGWAPTISGKHSKSTYSWEQTFSILKFEGLVGAIFKYDKYNMFNKICIQLYVTVCVLQ